MSEAKKIFFSNELLKWFDKGHRPLPWKGISNPYFIWLSEIILQQTRVEQGLPYYEKFIKNYPTIKDLADAPTDELMKHWEGLGYYSRARNLHETAKFIAYQLDGKFPDTYEAILKLKGIGEYTAAAIASFAYNLPYSVVDGNVYRVLARYFGIEMATDTKEGKKIFSTLAQTLLVKERAAHYNQAIMDFGATVCTPKNTQCKTCFLNSECMAYQTQKVEKLPIKEKKILKKERFFSYFVFKLGEKTWINKRQEKDVWLDLYEFPLVELTEWTEDWDALIHQHFQYKKEDIASIHASKIFKQTLTHLQIFARFIEVQLNENADISNLGNFLCIENPNITKFAFPKIIDSYLSRIYDLFD